MSAHRLLFSDLFARLRWRVPVLVFLMSLVGLTEGVSVALLLPLLTRIGIGIAGGEGLATATLERILAWFGISQVVEILAVIVAVGVIQAILFIGLHLWTARLARGYQRQRQSELFSAFIRARWSFISDQKAGELVNMIVTECERLGTAFTIGLSLMAATVIIIIYFVLSLLIAWQITLSLIGFALLTAMTMMRLYRTSYAVGQSLAPINAELQTVVGEQLASIKVVKATVSEQRAADRVESLLRRLEAAYVQVSFLPAMVRGAFELMALIGLSTMIVLGSYGMGVGLGSVLVVLALFVRLFPRITTLQAQLHYFNGYVHALEVINELQSKAESEAERQDHSFGSLEIALPTRLLLQDVEVTLGDRQVLHGINLAMSVPGMVAVVGGSGAGKSTLVHAVLGLVDPAAGSIRLGRYELAATPPNVWRRMIGYVPQETLLFHASVWDNIVLANPLASKAEVERVVRRAHADKFIAALPDGWDTIIGDQGIKLSGGQRQRLGIARALLNNPQLLVLDEAMSALDAESEAELLQTLQDLRSEMGILIVAHRLAAVKQADSIFVLEEGRIAETGTWDDLMSTRRRLHSLFEAQSLDLRNSADASSEMSVPAISVRDK